MHTMKKLLSLSLMTALLFTGGLFSNLASAKTAKVFIGSVAMDTPAEMVKRFKPLADYLSQKTGLAVSFKPSADMANAISDLGNNVVQISYLTPVAYIDAKKKYNVKPLVETLTLGESAFRLVIVVRDDSPLKTMSDLKGKTFAFGDEKALLQRAAVIDGGIKLEEFSKYAFLDHYDVIANAVLNKQYDAGILKESVYVDFRSKGLRVIHSSPDLPPYLFAVSSKTPRATAEKLRKAFVTLKADSPKHNAILKALDKGYTGFTDASDKDYDVVRRLLAPLR